MTDAADLEGSDLDALVRRVDPDRWLSSRFIADAAARVDVVAVYAFDHELARAPKVASSALLGEIRLTWWREALDEIFEDRPVRRHPTAQALAEVVRRRGLSRTPLETMIDGRYRELEPAPLAGEEALQWAGDTAGSAAVAAAWILDPHGSADAARPAGAAWALGRRLASGDLGTEGPGMLRDALAAARAHARRLGVAAFPAVAHAALASGRPGGSELGKRLKLTWAVARGRI
ncbi:squalene/phytoene synthase family protein [Phenylobacterium sp.]|jgi:phytoene synthase|uniref:squalene/phytoene synthase family protein n=1 Tax=Phenylobacterium sp. TaxID=1871053 RepID=UPI002F4020CC